ncbi:MAG: hypothetical protein ACK4VY_08130 [Brevundimonas sp.]
MFKLASFLIAVASTALAGAAAAQTVVDFNAASDDPARAQIEPVLRDAVPAVEAFFGVPFPEPVHFVLAKDRSAFDAAFPAAWEMGATQCWMVGVGVADFLVMLSPGVWATQVCDHSGSADEVRGILTHELVHTYHGQHNPTRDFTGAEDAGWFVEGLAVLVSGQLTEERLEAVREAVRRGEGPTSLETVWAGRSRYGQAGSLVQFVDQTWGRARLNTLLEARNTAELLSQLETTEADLIRDWRAWLVR